MNEFGGKREGFSLDELRRVKKFMKNYGCHCIIISLHKCLPDNVDDYEKAYALIARGGLTALIGDHADEIWDELCQLELDKHSFMKGRVVTNRSRWTLCFADAGARIHNCCMRHGRGWTVVTTLTLSICCSYTVSCSFCFGVEHC
jgi:hypothetical protein